jgi:MoaA/NifB/PqqE/SkfB family radical SAM enzyme
MNRILRESSSPSDIDSRKREFLRKVGQRKRLEGLFLFVTSRCNSKCRTCFYHASLNDGRDLGFAEIERLARTAPQFNSLWLSGGEPTMREDLPEIIELFYARCGIKAVNFPSNGLLPDRLEQMVERLVGSCPKLELHVNLSLDGFGFTHDAIRGVPGGFRKTLRTLERLRRRYAGNARVVVNVASVVTPENVGELYELGAFLLERDLVGAQVFEVPRGNPLDPGTQGLTSAEMRAFHAQIYPLFGVQADRLFKDFGTVGRHVAKAFYLGFIRFLQERQIENMDGPHDWGMACTAGQTTLVVDHDGQFRSCEMRPPIGNVTDFDCDVGAIMQSDRMRREIAAIGGGYRANCWCTHACWLMSSMKFSPRTLLWRLPEACVRAQRMHRRAAALPRVDPERLARYEASLAGGAVE